MKILLSRLHIENLTLLTSSIFLPIINHKTKLIEQLNQTLILDNHTPTKKWNSQTNWLVALSQKKKERYLNANWDHKLHIHMYVSINNDTYTLAYLQTYIVDWLDLKNGNLTLE